MACAWKCYGQTRAPATSCHFYASPYLPARCSLLLSVALPQGSPAPPQRLTGLNLDVLRARHSSPRQAAVVLIVLRCWLGVWSLPANPFALGSVLCRDRSAAYPGTWSWLQDIFSPRTLRGVRAASLSSGAFRPAIEPVPPRKGAPGLSCYEFLQSHS